MLKNSKVTLGLPHSDPVTESVADLLTLAEPLDYKSSRMSMGLSPGAQPAMGKGLLPSPGDEEGRPAWNSKLQYILAQVGFSVGLGNVWRFPYLCQKNGGVIEPECEKSSATTYFWYRQTLNITSTIEDSGGLNWKMTMSLFAAWLIVCLAVIKGIQSSGKVMYFSSLFPYVVLICFLVRGLMLKGSVDGIAHMFTPKLEKMLEPQVWREAATQVFFALGLGFGGVIAFSSYNKRDNNCHFDAALVSIINFITSILATLVVFAVLGFKANIMNEKCVVENAEKILGYLKSGVLSLELIPPHVNFSHLSAVDYQEMYGVIKTVREDSFDQLGLDPCILEDELNKAVQGTGLAFIAFTEAMTHFPASPFWSVMFFFMLINLGLGSMIGTMTGITTPVLDAFPKIRKEFLCVGCCIVAFFCGLLFVQRSGNYFVTMFDDYSAGLPLTVVVILENISVAWIYGTKRFMQDLEDMLGFRPYSFYFYMWKYVSPACLTVLIVATVIEMAVSPAGYNAWVEELASEKFLSYPPWALGVAYSLIIAAMLPLPCVFIARHFNLLSDGSNKLSVSYRKGMTKELSGLEEENESRFILGKGTPSPSPSPMPSHRPYLGPGGAQEMTNTAGYGTGTPTKTGYQNINSPESEL
uniref:Sodium-dependent neutral amino acid transporter SLC6A17 n=1 Tax=Oncorhynchus tshawytscha TaxID=74940 RepID=A0A8C8IZK2_ONCTS